MRLGVVAIKKLDTLNLGVYTIKRDRPRATVKNGDLPAGPSGLDALLVGETSRSRCVLLLFLSGQGCPSYGDASGPLCSSGAPAPERVRSRRS